MTVPALLNGRLSSTGLTLTDPNMTFEEFERICTQLGEMHATVRQADMGIKFAIGDAILAGEELYGQRAYQAFEEFGLSPASLAECCRIAKNIPRSRRRANLTWSHHRALAAQPPEERDKWLQKAGVEQLSHHELREALRGTRVDEEIRRCECCGRAL